jgi:hypothetical protein
MPAGSSTYVVVGGMTTILNKYTPIEFTQKPMHVSAAAFPLMKKGELDLGITTLYAIAAGYSGLEPFATIYKFPGKFPFPITQLSAGYHLSFGFMTTNPDIKTLKDIEGKKVAIRTPATPWELAKPILDVEGVDISTMKLVTFPALKELPRYFIEGKVEVAFDAITPWVLELKKSKELYPIPIPADVIRETAEKYPDFGMTPITVKAGPPWGFPESYSTMGLPFAVYAHEDLDPEVTYLMVKTLYEHHDELAKINPRYLGPWTLDNALLGMVAPIHPGAIKYFKEQGIWTEKHQKRQEQLLKMKKMQ